MNTRPDLINWVRNRSVDIPEHLNEKLIEMLNWCLENIGDDSGGHPMGEAQEGWIDYLEGDWAFEDNSFWFYRKEDMMKFMLTFL